MSGRWPKRIGAPIPLETMQLIAGTMPDYPVCASVLRWGDGKTLELYVGRDPEAVTGIRIAFRPDEARQLVNLIGQALART